MCVGLNYADHAAEGGRAAPERPLLFAKFANTVVGDGEAIVRPEGTHALDLEVELGVVIGRSARRVSADDALDYVAGYVVVNDISARDWQGNPGAARGREGRRPVAAGQGLATRSCRSARSFVTPDEMDPAAGLAPPELADPRRGPRRRHAHPDAGRQHHRHDLFDVPRPDRASSRRTITLEPGDVIATGHAIGRRASSAIRRSSWSPATGSAARSRGSARSRTRSSTGPRTRGPSPDRRHRRAATRRSAHARPRQDRARPRARASATCPIPAIGINDVLIRVHKTGICGTDLHIESWDPWAAQDDQAAAGRRPRVRRRDRRGRLQRRRLRAGRPRQRRGPRGLRSLPPLPGRAAPPVRQHDRPRRRAGRRVRRVRGPAR